MLHIEQITVPFKLAHGPKLHQVLSQVLEKFSKGRGTSRPVANQGAEGGRNSFLVGGG